MNCLRCGRETGENQSFCPQCVKTVSQPLEESPYLSTRVFLPVRKPAPIRPAPGKGKKPERKAENQRNASHRLVWVGVALVLVLALLSGHLYGVNLTLKDEISTLKSQNALQSDRMDRVNQVMVLAEEDENRLYHTLDCPEADGTRCILMELKLALQQKYQPCPECH